MTLFYHGTMLLIAELQTQNLQTLIPLQESTHLKVKTLDSPILNKNIWEIKINRRELEKPKVVQYYIAN